MKATFYCALAALSMQPLAFGQGFINLNFEQAVVQPIDGPGGIFLEWGLAAPGWAHSDAPDAQYIYHNSTHLGVTPAYTLIDSLAPAYWPRPFEGTYSLLFRNGTFSTAEPLGWVNAFIAQTALIPAAARSVRLLASGPFGVFVNGTEIPLVSLGGMAYGGDISGFAGMVGELKILNQARPIAEEVSLEVMVDGIHFSPLDVPEPSAVLLLLVGGVFLRGRWLVGPKRGEG